MHMRLFQDHHDKPADEMGEREISQYLHYLLTEKGLTHASVKLKTAHCVFCTASRWTGSSTHEKSRESKTYEVYRTFSARKNSDMYSICARI